MNVMAYTANADPSCYPQGTQTTTGDLGWAGEQRDPATDLNPLARQGRRFLETDGDGVCIHLHCPPSADHKCRTTILIGPTDWEASPLAGAPDQAGHHRAH